MPTGNGESHGDLHDIFPGETVQLSNGKAVVVVPWSAWHGIHEALPRIFSILQTLGPALSQVGTDSELIKERILVAAQGAASAILDFVAEEVGLVESDLRAIRLAETVRIFRAILEQNLDFFVEIAKTRGVIASLELTGRTSPPS